MKKFLLAAAVAATLAATAEARDGLHGSRATFLLDDDIDGFNRTSMYYLSPELGDRERAHLRAVLRRNGDTHVYTYTRATSKRDSGAVPENAWPTFREKLSELNRAGLKPILWLTPESKHGYHRGDMNAHKAYMETIIKNLDGEAAGYVVCLECDDYWKPAVVNHLVAFVKSKTKKPVGVHLNKGYGGLRKDPSYYKGVDYIFLQLHGNEDAPASAVATLKAALAAGIPVIAAEYSKNGTSSLARALGDELCKQGAVGTGSGRNVTVCGQGAAPVDKPEKRKRGSDNTLLYAALIGAAVYYLNKNFDFIWELEYSAQHDGDTGAFGVSKPFQLTERSRVSFSLEHQYEEGEDSENRVMLQYRLSF